MSEIKEETKYSEEKIDKMAEIIDRAAKKAVKILSEIDPDFLTKKYHKSDEEWNMIQRLKTGISLEICFFSSFHKKDYWSD